MKLRVQINNETYLFEVGDLTKRPILAVVDGETFEIYPEELETISVAAPALVETRSSAPAERPAPKPAPVPLHTPPAASPQAGSGTLTAPIPGVILSVAVKVGDVVNLNQEICVLEAMKMKNTIRTTRAGTISAVHVSNGDTVSHGQPLVDY